MTPQLIGGVMFLALGCPLMGGLPITQWITRLLAHKNLSELGTRNVGVSAAFYHGGTLAGMLAVCSEAAKGIGAVWGARLLFPGQPVWELVALVMLVVGRYRIGHGAGTTNVVWGIVAYNWQLALGLWAVSATLYTLVRDRQRGKQWVLILLPLLIALVRRDLAEALAAIVLSSLLGWIYTRLADDLDLPAQQAAAKSQPMFTFFQGRAPAIRLSLDQPLDVDKVGGKAATLSQLKRWGYAFPQGWVLPPGDDAEPLIAALNPAPEVPLVARSSAIGEDTAQASAAGQYETVLQVTSKATLRRAIARCQDSYDDPAAVQYRADRGAPEGGMAVLVQVQVAGQFSGVAFSRDPVAVMQDMVAIEVLPGGAAGVVSGQITPERYTVRCPSADELGRSPLPEDLDVAEPSGQTPAPLIHQVALLVRELEGRYHGIPQDMEWTYDGQILWILQTRPITTLLPIWTRRIAAEVIPGVICPLTWSINQPLTCGVWVDLFRLVLGRRLGPFQAQDMATLHYGQAYFNATLLGQLFLRMGLPPESLEFLTRGAAMSRPSPRVMLRTAPGLLRLVRREGRLPQDFRRANQQVLTPLLTTCQSQPPNALTSPQLLDRLTALLEGLRQATYFSILAPLSVAIRQSILRVKDEELDATVLPETAALRSLQEMAQQHPVAIATLAAHLQSGTTLTAVVQAPPADLQDLSQAIASFLETYGYLSEVETDSAVPTWREDPEPVWSLLAQMSNTNPDASVQTNSTPGVGRQRWVARQVQQRLLLKGQVAQVYSRLLAELRYSLLALEQQALKAELLTQRGDLFFLTESEIRAWVLNPSPGQSQIYRQQIRERRLEQKQFQQLPLVPTIVYGTPSSAALLQTEQSIPSGTCRGIGASPGMVTGQVRVVRSLRQLPSNLSRQTILVVPYTDAGWAPLLAQVGGLIAEVGGRLSHGAIVAREYGIPAVMDVTGATQRFTDGQQISLNGYLGTVELLED